MFRYFIVILLTLSAAFSARAQDMKPVNEVSIVALIITSGVETPVSASVARSLEALDAQVLTAIAPNASQMRSVLKRFASAALDVDIALVYYDGAVLRIGDRAFVAPGEITLRRSSDLLTKAIPLSALARAAALAGQGGAVLVHSTAQEVDLIDGVTLVDTAPGPRVGTAPVLFANAAAAANLADGLETLVQTQDDIRLSDALSGLASLDGISISQRPTGQAMLRHYPVAEVAAPAMETQTSQTEPQGDEAENPALPDLPQVGEGTPEADSAADVAAALEAATRTAPAEAPPATADAEGNAAAQTPETTADTAEPAAESQPDEAALAVDSELSLDVLRAMQGALSRGQKRIIQKQLRDLGFYRGLIDGIFGPQTARAISAYQESIGAGITGVLTPVQMEALSQ